MRGFPDAYTIYTANREQCWNPHHLRHYESVLPPHSARAQPGRMASQALAHTLKFGLLDMRGRPYEEGTSRPMTR
jgi:hypothetical protein